jgi:hypothetical protein
MRARSSQWPTRTWIEGDVSRADDVERALAGCQAAYYLVHGLADNASALVERERAQHGNIDSNQSRLAKQRSGAHQSTSERRQSLPRTEVVP